MKKFVAISFAIAICLLAQGAQAKKADVQWLSGTLVYTYTPLSASEKQANVLHCDAAGHCTPAASPPNSPALSIAFHAGDKGWIIFDGTKATFDDLQKSSHSLPIDALSILVLQLGFKCEESAESPCVREVTLRYFVSSDRKHLGIAIELPAVPDSPMNGDNRILWLAAK